MSCNILLRSEARQPNWMELYRIYKEEGLTLRKRGGRKRSLVTSVSFLRVAGLLRSDDLKCDRNF
jgi:hypothetical protein